MSERRVSRLNSLLKEVLSEVLTQDLHHIPGVSTLMTITSVEITSDLSFAKVFVSVIGNQVAKDATLEALNRVAGVIARTASKKVVLRSFPKLHFYIDEGLEKQLKISELLAKVAPPTPTEEPSL
jgi:ribosome-binding factor A